MKKQIPAAKKLFKRIGSTKRKSGASQWNIAWRRFKKNRAALAGFILVGVMIFLAIFEFVLAPYPPNDLSGFYNGEVRVPPSISHPFGDYTG